MNDIVGCRVDEIAAFEGIRLGARSEELVPEADVAWLAEAEAEAADADLDPSEIVGIDVDGGVIEAKLFIDADDSWAGNEAPGFVNAADSCCAPGFDTAVGEPEVT